MSEPARPSRGRRVWTWTRRVLIALAVLLLVARLSHPLWLPRVLDRVVAGRGLTLHYRDLDLSLLGGRIDLTRVVLAPRDADPAAPPLALVDHVGVDVDVSALLFGDLRVHRAVVDGVALELSRDASGSWNVAPYLVSEASPDEAPATAEPDDPDDAEAPVALDFGLPVEVELAALHGLRVHLTDALADPPLDTVLSLDASLADVGHAELPARVHVVAAAREVCDALRVDATARGGERTLALDGHAELAGVHLARLAPYLALVGIEPSAQRLDLGLRFRADLQPLGEEGEDATGTLHLDGLQLASEQGEHAALDGVVIEIARASTRAAVVPRIAVTGLRGHAARRADGALRVAGLDLVGGGAPAAETPAPAEAEAAAGAPFALQLGVLSLEQATFTFDDASTSPPAHLALAVEAEVRDLVLDPARAPTPVALSLGARLEDAGALAVAGTALPMGPERRLALQVTGTDVTLAALAPYLSAAGLQSDLEHGRLSLALEAQAAEAEDGGLRVEARLADLAWTDGEQRLFELGEARVDGLSLAPGGDVRIEAVALAGLRLPAAVEADGSARVLGFHTVPAVGGPPVATADAAPEAPAAPPAPTAQGEAPPPRLELARLTWSDTALDVRIAGEEPLDLSLRDVAIELRDLAFGGDPAQHAPAPAHLTARASLPEVVQELSATGTWLAAPGALDVDGSVDLAATGVTLARVRPLLARIGCEPTFQDGALVAHVEARVAQRGEALYATARLADVALSDGDGGAPLLGLEEAVVRDLVLTPAGVEVGELLARGPRARAARDADGALLLLGLRFPPPAGAATAPAAPSDGAAAPAVETPASSTAAAPPVVRVARAALENAVLEWSDAAVGPALDVALELGAVLEGLSTAPGASDASFALLAGLAGSLDTLSVEGALRADPADLALDARLAGRGVRAGAFAAYLPPGLVVTSEDGRLDGALSFGSRALDDGGRDLRLAVTDVAWREGEQEPWLALESLRLNAPRLDPQKRTFEIAEARSAGLALDVRRTERGLELLGLAVQPLPAEPAAPAQGDPATAQGDSGTAQGVEPSAPQGDPAAQVGVATPPTVRLGALDLSLARLRWVDEVAGEAPLELSLRLVTDGPQVLCSPEAEALPPLACAVRGAALPLVESLAVDITASPWIADPELGVECAVEGVRGDELARVLPTLAADLDAAGVEGGSFHASLSALLRMARRSPVDFDFTRGFGAELGLRDVAWRARPDGEVLAGVQRVAVDVRRVRPTTGDVTISSVEIEGLRGRARQTAEGLSVAGVVLRTPAAAPPSPDELAAAVPEPATEPATDPAATDPATEPVAEADEAAALEAPEVRVDRLAVTGLDFEFVDETVEPPLVLPIDDLEVEVRGLTTRALVEPRSIAFRVRVDAGEVALPERSGADDLLSGVLGSVAGALSGCDDSFEVEQRRVWDQLEVKGRMRLAPALEGRAQVDVAGLELPAFAGPASAAGVEIGDGLVDTHVGLRFRGDRGLGVDLRTTMSYLSLSEPPDGPISSYLRLPAPLDTVLFLLRDESGQQTIPLRVDVGPDGVSVSAVAGAAGQALVQLVADSLSAAPMRLLAPLTSVADALGLTPDAPTAETVRVRYSPGVARLDAPELALVDPLLEALRADPSVRVVVQHELGRADVARAEELANPTPEESGALVTRLRDRKAALERERGEMAALTRAQYAVGVLDQARAGTDELERLDRELVAVEAGLDSVLELLRPGAERRREQRTRTAALALAQERLDLLRTTLLARGGRDLAARLDVRSPRFAPADGDETAGGTITLTPRGVE